jgi:tetratricopeptide (TPR) repeat protein
MTARQALESRPEELRRLVEPLRQRLDAGKPLDAAEAEALAEAYFRIGVHRGTPPAAALDALARAHRLDPANPRHPYHLGLLHLRHGQPETAVRWLTAAAGLSPVNHRVRAHLSLAYRELDAIRRGTADHDGGDGARAERIAEAVRAGVDAFDPGPEPKPKRKPGSGPKPDPEPEPESGSGSGPGSGTDPDPEPGSGGREGSGGAAASAVALIRPGACRWSGIHDLEVDHRLRGRTTQSARRALAAQLETVAGFAAGRPGGAAAFTVSAVQWMVHGYPPATIRRLAGLLPAGGGPSARLLGLVCELFEADLAELPSRLARCLAERSLPDVLVALIHRQRLLWRPLGFPNLGVLAAAREFTEGDPDRHVKALQDAWRKLSVGPPEQMADAADGDGAQPSAALSPDEQFAALEQTARALADLRGELQGRIRELGRQKVASESDFARLAGDRKLLEEVIEGLERLRVGWVGELQRFKAVVKPDALSMRFGEYQRRYEACESAFQESFRSLLSQLRKPVDRELKRARDAHGAAGPSPSREAVELAERSAALPRPPGSAASAGDGPPAGAQPPGPAHARTAPAPPPADAPARERVGHAVNAAEQALDANFAEAWQTLGIYPAALRRRDAFVLLRGYIGGRQAEAEFRLGRPTPARRWWAGLLADDRLHPAVLRNLAVAHTLSGDPVPAAEAWQRYVDTIYLRDLLNGEIRRGAAARADLHRVFAASFGTGPLCTALIPQDDDREETERQIPPLLAGRAKVAIVTAHLRLEELNHTYAHRSPTLLLGIQRTEAAAAPEARERRAAALGAAVLGLPDRIRAPFEKECLRLLDDACAEVVEAKGRVRRPGDEAEEAAHEQWARNRIWWKYGIRRAVLGGDADWPLTEYSGAVIGNLRLVDRLTLDPADAIMRACLQRFQPDAEPATVIERLDNLSFHAAAFAYGRILDAAEKAADSPADARIFAERFRRISRSWDRNPVPGKLLEALDDPLDLYGEAANRALRIVDESDALDGEGARDAVAAAVPVLEGLVDRLPGATGPARSLARLLGALGRHDEAFKVLTRAEAEAFSFLGRGKVLRARVLLDIVRGEFAAAVALLRRELAEHPDDEQLRGLLVTAFDRWIGSGAAVPSVQTIAEAFTGLTDEATVRNRRVLVLNAAMARHAGLGEGNHMDTLVLSLRAIVTADPDHLDAHYHLSTALYGLAAERHKEMGHTARADRKALRAAMADALAECERRTDALLPGLEGDQYAEQRDQLAQILKKVRDALR